MADWEDAPAPQWEDAPSATDYSPDDSPEAAEAKAQAGAGETILHGLSTIPAALGGGLAYAGTLATTFDPKAAAAVQADTQNALTYQPRTQQGQGAVDAAGRAIAPVAQKAEELANRVGEGTAEETGSPALGAVERAGLSAIRMLAGGGGARGLAREMDAASESAVRSAAETPAPPKATPGPVTAEHLQASPPRLPDPPTKAAQGAPEAPPPQTPAKPKIVAKAGESAEQAASRQGVAPAPQFVSPEREGTAHGPLPEAEQAQRQQALKDLHEDSGGQLPEHRVSAVTGDYSETGADHQYAKGEDEGGQKIKATIAQENTALKAASERASSPELTGDRAVGTTAGAVNERGTVIDRALQGVGDWFDNAIKGQYRAADAAAKGVPMQKFDTLQGMLEDHSQFAGIDGRQLHSDVQSVAKQFGMLGDDGFWKPTTVETAERFRQWVGEQGANPRIARTVGRLKDAVDADVAAHGGQGLYDAGRKLRYQRDQMLEGPNGIRKLTSVDKYGNRGTEVDKIPDALLNMGQGQFEHVINVLHDSSKLGNGELAAGNAAAINAIRGHMAARLHEAGASARDLKWDPHGYYNALDKYSLKMPKVFSPEGIDRFRTINRAGNVLRMDKSYPGAGAQIQKLGGLGALARDRIAHIAEGAVTGTLGPIGGAAVEAVGGGAAIRKGVNRLLGGGSETAREAALKARVQPLGAKLPGQRGAVGHLNAPGVVHDYEPSTGHHEVQSPNGVTHANDHANGKDIVVDNTHTEPAGRGAGEGFVRMKKLADAAIERGGELRSDSSVSPHQVPIYDHFARAGYKVELNPNASRTVGIPDYGKGDVPTSLVREENGEPKMLPGYTAPKGEAVFRVSKPLLGARQALSEPVKLGQNPAFRRQAGAVSLGGDIYNRSPAKDIWGNERAVKDRTQENEKRSNNPYDSGGGKATPLGARIAGGRQRGAVGDLTRKPAAAPAEEPAKVNIGLHVNGGPAAGGSVLDSRIAKAQLKAAGAKIGKTSIQNPPGGEPTLVADIDRPLTDVQAQKIAKGTGQDAIAQRHDDGTGRMFVRPGKEDVAAQQGWDKYNSDYFQMHDGRSATKHDAEAKAFNEVKPHLTDKEAADIENRSDSHRAAAVKNLLDTFHGSTSIEGVSAMALAGQAKKGWYAKAAKAINSVFGPDAPRFTALLAAMSPQTSVEMNFHNALHTFVNWDKAGRPTDPGAIKKIMEDSSLKNPDSESESNVMDAWHQNGVRALTSADPEHESFQLSGPKVDSFHKNLRGHVNEVTNDSWNAIATNIDQKLFSGAYRKAVGDIFGRMGFKSPTYMGVSAKVRAAALQLSKLTGESWSPSEVQETMWSFVKTAFEHAKATGKSIPELIKSGELNDELIRGTSDFHTLFSAPEHRGFLADSRFGAAAERVDRGESEGAKPARAGKARSAAQETLRPNLLSEGQRLETARQARLANRKARIGNIQVPF